MATQNNYLGLLEKLESRDVTVRQNRCVRVRNRNATCQRCADACTSGCISYDDNQIIVQPELCIGCGTCATVCPTCALEAHRPNDAQLFDECLAAARKANGKAIIACRQIAEAASGLYDPEKVVVLACLGRVEESLIVDLALEGVGQVVLVKGMCDDCPNAIGLETAQSVCDTANVLLETWGNATRSRVSAKFPGDARISSDEAYDKARRDFFTNLKDEAKDVAVVGASYAVDDALGVEQPSVPEQDRFLKVDPVDGTLPHFVPDRRERLLNGLVQMGEPADVMISTRLWGHVIIDLTSCKSCQMCATFCPTAALSKFKDEDGTFGVEHAPSDCVKCRCCEDICPAHALTISDEVFAVDLMDGVVERYAMPPVEVVKGKPMSIIDSLRSIIDCDQIYAR